MAERRRGELKQLKKDPNVQRDTRDDLSSEITQDGNAPQYRNPNRDQARGDWDRSGRRTDEDRARDLPVEGDDGLGPKSKR